MDKKDEKLVALLRRNARLSTSEIARQIGMSRTTVQDRINRLEDIGVIAGYTLKMGEKGETGVRAHVMLKIQPRAQVAVVASMKKMDEVLSIYTISGEYDMIAIVGASTTSALDYALDTLGGIEGVERTKTSILLTTKLER
ncbi:Lrp/AsnC family transcriptional regulator [Temperatibacter marinus]|uniref:Lrp/AsnC family transcriptional regulator n=1 Tax=Temperatibacter marinus TaxID=1456591 RepID=A0AA52HAN6_9PROT|nr:Lrp/AsnC family transcriptional regulator [Temperatibacter marinus]WND04164.1 Lrp/AsnC family transcriptional regulator [Temperatibacter marinus]